jgi:hypothetical protein
VNGQVWTVLIVAIAVVIVLVVFRDRLREFWITANKQGLRAKLKSEPRRESPPEVSDVVIERNRLIGWKHLIDVARKAIVRRNVLLGEKSEIKVRPDSVSEKERRAC